MSTKEGRAKERILKAAEELFQVKGYHQVTVREIARKAGCSHTSIYVYYGEKRKLLELLAKKPLNELREDVRQILAKSSVTPSDRLVALAKRFVHFGLVHRNLYEAFLHAEATRVDIPTTLWELNDIRMQLFDMLKKAVALNHQPWNEERVVSLSRMLYYALHGMIMTYKDSDESIRSIERRVLPIVEQTVHVFLKGAIQS
ncbi:TetR/AcrR family transcriptional regulator [Halalkalibacterium halodurans]|jgi:AcrR family transcriptional regulator|uniref:TetR/AcrR family transcriptional regulator n=1 Tax=Halalkalibacterium halodurans TaxID=86665 RepID=UPI002E1D314A|nr:TetR/AcrR family transcriptional regulator [Halalkalibacterium halodurans]